MKLKASQKVHYDAGPNMTPLVDIVMVILIFLMLTGTFAAGELYLQSNAPVTNKKNTVEKADTPPKDKDLTTTDVEIRVDSVRLRSDTGQYVDVWKASVGKKKYETRKELGDELQRVHAQLNGTGTPTDKIQVIISPGGNTLYSHLVVAYQAAMDAKFTKVAFSTAH